MFKIPIDHFMQNLFPLQKYLPIIGLSCEFAQDFIQLVIAKLI